MYTNCKSVTVLNYTGNFICGLVIIKTDSGHGRLTDLIVLVSCFWWIQWFPIRIIYGNYLTQLYERKYQCHHYLGIFFLIETMISVSKYVVITIIIFLSYPLPPCAWSYVLMSLPCMASSILTLIFFIGWYRYKYRGFSRTYFIPKSSIYIITVCGRTVHFYTTYKV